MFLSIMHVPAPRKEIMSTVRVISPIALATIVAPTLRATVSEQKSALAPSLISYLTSAAVTVKSATATPL